MNPPIGAITAFHKTTTNLDIVSKLGMPCTQVTCWDMSLATAEKGRMLRKMAEDANVRFTGIWGGYSGPVEWNFTHGPISLGIVPVALRQRRIDDLKRWADFAVEAGAPALITHAGFLPENGTDPEFWPVVLAVREIASYCKARGLGFWFETGQETPVALLRVIAAAGMDNLGINLDPANLILYGKGNPIDALSVFGSYVRSVHVKDGLPPTSPNELGHEVLVGTGAVRFPEFIPKLLECGFNGDLIIEREISGEQQFLDIQKTVSYLESLFPADSAL